MFRKLKDGIDKSVLFLSLFFLVSMVLVILYQVFSRQILGTAPSWSEEISRLLFIWVGFLGMAHGFKEKAHIGVGLIVKKFPKKLQHACDIFSKTLVLVFGGLMIYYGWSFTVVASGSTMPGTGMPSSVMYIIIPVVGVILILNAIELFFKEGMHEELEDEWEEA